MKSPFILFTVATVFAVVLSQRTLAVENVSWGEIKLLISDNSSVQAGKLVVSQQKIGGMKEMKITSPSKGEILVMGQVKIIRVEGNSLNLQLLLKAVGKSHWRGLNVKPAYNGELNTTDYRWVVGAMPGMFGSGEMALAGYYCIEIGGGRSAEFGIVYPDSSDDIDVYNAFTQIEELNRQMKEELNTNGYTEKYEELYFSRRSVESYLNGILLSRCIDCEEYSYTELW